VSATQAALSRRFDRWALTYDQGALQPLYGNAHRAVLGAAAAMDLSPRRILDVGCGTGRLIGELVDLFPAATIVGLDLSAGMVSAARASVPKGRTVFCQAVAERLPFACASFDLVTATVSFRHWIDQYAGLREIARVLSPAAPLLLAGVGDPPRRPRRGVVLPAPLQRAALARNHLTLRTVERIAGFGPVSELTMVVATRRRRSPCRDHSHR